MKNFYKEISNYYEDIFPYKKEKIDFLNNLTDGKKYLDIGCATGLVSKNLKDLGNILTSIDIENEMVNKAKEKGLNAFVKNMLDIDDFKEKFDLCYSIGTTIAHLENMDEIYKFLNKVSNILKDNGFLVLQWVNFYPFIIKDGDFLGTLPTLGTEVKFKRSYYREKEKIRFKTVLTKDNLKLENSVLLLPILDKDIVKYLEKLNFSIEIFGDFKKSKFDENFSKSVVLVARKK